MQRLRALDGLRAASIALVLLGHGALRPWRTSTGDLGNLGVRWFFVISGLLITTLLLEEMRATGSLDLRRFYLRRVLRIFPAFYALLAGLYVAQELHWIPAIDRSSWLHAQTYTMNYLDVTDRTWSVGHLWSLAVEEQFYLLWPFLLLLLGRKKGIAGAALVVLIVPLVRWGTWRLFPGHAAGIKWQFQTVCDSLATGCVLAGVRDLLWQLPGWRRFIASPAMWLVLASVFAANCAMVGRPNLNYLFAQTWMNLGIALWIERCTRLPDGAVGRVLEWRPIAFMGVLSYSIYLWQQPFFDHGIDSPFTRGPLNLVCIAALALLSYYLVERPFLRLKRRFERPTAAAARPARGPG